MIVSLKYAGKLFQKLLDLLAVIQRVLRSRASWRLNGLVVFYDNADTTAWQFLLEETTAVLNPLSFNR